MEHIGLILKVSDPTDWVSLIIFLQLHLAADSTSLTRMATPFGRYKFLRLPFGLSSSPEAYQQIRVDLSSSDDVQSHPIFCRSNNAPRN